MPVAFAEGRITKLRREAKLALAPAEAAALRARLAAEVGAPAVSRVVSVYFDGPGWPLAARAAAAPHDTVKLRFKEYFPDRGGSGSDRVVPTRQFGTESRLGWVVGIANLPSQTTLQNYGPEKMATITSHQHPDHD